jgi:hypothetical protein
MIAQFLHDNGLALQTDIETLRSVIQKHLEYNTIVTLYDDKGLYAVTVFNIIDKVCIVINSAVRKDRRNPQVLKDMIKEGLIRYPDTKYLKFERVLKNKPMHLVKISKFIKE